MKNSRQELMGLLVKGRSVSKGEVRGGDGSCPRDGG